MSPKIQEIALKAGYRPLPGFDFANSLEQVFLQKFAEMLIQDCADLCLPEPGIKYSPNSLGSREDCRRKILKEFGLVEN